MVTYNVVLDRCATSWCILNLSRTNFHLYILWQGRYEDIICQRKAKSYSTLVSALRLYGIILANSHILYHCVPRIAEDLLGSIPERDWIHSQTWLSL